ncbi:MAG: ATP-binding cassette domain-containing protein [Dehalobacter sp. 4CP]|uniref:ATP-binding cassette domain-containing protein n=1 Tax=Dehalobacter sp. CP TaxID=2594474 RepID=UPI0013CACAA2|nr:ATP-binding cassette domain-containing protein [Dehalobacter sp. 4CP]
MLQVIGISGLVKKFGKFTALDGVNLNVKQGKVHAFLGPNGAGKSTTIRCLLGILKATSGNVALFGQDA